MHRLDGNSRTRSDSCASGDWPHFHRRGARGDVARPVCRRHRLLFPRRLPTGELLLDSEWTTMLTVDEAPVTGLSSLGLDENDVASLLDSRSQAGAPSEYAASEASSSRPLPPHLRGSIAGSKKSLTPSTDQPHAGASSRSSFVQQLPPHLRPFVQQALVPDASSHSAVGSEFGDTGSISTATTAREARAKVRRISFNAWDPKGVAHRAAKTATESSATATSETTESEAGGASLGSHTPEAVAKSKWPKTKDVGYDQLVHDSVADPVPESHVPDRVAPSRYQPPRCGSRSRPCEASPGAASPERMLRAG